MAWDKDRPSPRNASRPLDWPRRRAAALRRDRYVCGICGGSGADQVDHIVSVANGGSHDLDNLQSAHGDPCAARKNAAEATAARWRYRNAREPEPHPGMLPSAG